MTKSSINDFPAGRDFSCGGTFGDKGGSVFNSVHNIQSNVLTENVLDMLKAVHDVRK